MRYQAAEVRDILLEVRDNTTDPVIKIEAPSLAVEVGSYRFSKMQYLNKLLQCEKMRMDFAVDLWRKTEASLVSYRETGLASAQASAKERCQELNVKAILKQKRLGTKKTQFSYVGPDEELTNALRKKISFFNGLVD